MKAAMTRYRKKDGRAKVSSSSGLDKNTVILIILLGALVIFWVPIMTFLGFIKPPAEQPRPTVEEPVREQPLDLTQQQPAPTGGAATTPPQMTVGDTTTIEKIPEDTIIVKTKVWEIAFSNYGGGPISFKLLDYHYANDGPVQMLPENVHATPSFSFNSGSVKDKDLVYNPARDYRHYDVTSSPQELVYTYSGPNGGTITKRYRFSPDRYDFELILEIADRPALGFEREYAINWNNKLMPTELDINDDFAQMWAMAYQNGVRVKIDDYDNNRYQVSYQGVTNWIATRSKYFTAIILPRSQTGIEAHASGIKYKTQIGTSSVEAREIAVGIAMPIEYSPTLTDSFTIYVGPIDYDLLSDYDNEVVDLIDIGTTPFVGWIIKIFAVPILWLLPRMYNFIPNYGLVIIIFSLLIKVITFPLTKKTLKSMMGMKKLAPKMEELKVKHKNNPQALNREMMKLYKEMGINPLSGCLPLLPQMPLFFALFAVFRSTILLRQAPFILWWDDLSRGALSLTDPYMILVVLMVVLMFLQQKTGMTDPKNKALTYIFPLMLGFFFYKASAGLVLYWTCFSLFSFIEQIIYKRPMMEKADAEVKVQ